MLASACQARTTVDIRLENDGGGSVEAQVRLDDEAAAAIPNLGEQLRTSDLKAAGWSVKGPKREGPDTVVTVEHGFSNPAQANGLLRQLGGADGPFRDFELRQSRTLAHTESQFTGRVDLSRGVQSLGDGVLQDRFGSPLGIDTNEIESSLAVDLENTFPVDIQVHLPGKVVKVTPPAQPKNGWTVPYGSVTPLEKSSEDLNTLPLTFVILAGLSALSALVIALLWKSDKYRPKHFPSRVGSGVRARDFLAGREKGGG